MPRKLARFAALLAVLIGTLSRAQDAYFRVPFGSLTITEGAWPQPADWSARRWQMKGLLRPYAVLDGDGEAYVASQADANSWNPPAPTAQTAILHARVPAGQSLSGSLFAPKRDLSGMTRIRFTLDPAAASGSAHKDLLLAKADHYEYLVSQNVPGAAFFRWQADQTRRTLEADFQRPRFVPRAELSDTYNLFTGGSAVSENLQLTRDITAAQNPAAADTVPGQDLVPVSSITGITVQQMDFKTLLAGAEPVLDPLAAAIPADQHAVFFPSFDALAAIADETSEDGLPLFRGFGARSEDGGLIARYERQIGLSTKGLARLLGPRVLKSIALTGSDPYFPTGTDLALVFETENASALRDLLLTQATLATGRAPGVQAVKGETNGVSYSGFTTPDRTVSSYIAVIGANVVATNSLYQLRRLASVQSGASPDLASLDEYRFFRARYPRDSADESAFIMLSDAAIRRWCAAEWRIATSRRLRAAAVIADITAAHLSELVSGVAQERPVLGEVPMRTIGQTTLGPDGVRSSVYNTLAFITPAAELGITEVTTDEAAAYERWRDTYQRNWRWAFDPIAISLSIKSDRLAADMTVMPLILSTQYSTWMSFAQGAKIAPAAGDPHDAIAHAVVAVNVESQAVKQASGMALMFEPGIGIDPLGWLGQSVALYADADPFWAEMLSAANSDTFLEDNFHRFPVALRAEVGSTIKLTAFLASARGFIEQSAPGMAAWENRTHNDQPYVRVGASERAKSEGLGGSMDNAAVFYAAMPRALILSFNEIVLKRAIEREQTRVRDGQNAAAPAHPWLGESLCLKFTRDGLDLIGGPGGETIRVQMQRSCWNNLPALNEWKRHFPDRDPVKVHESIWGVRPVCPGGGDYVWNEQFRTISSTVYGCPAEPKPGPDGLGPLQSVLHGNLGLTFEDNGLRAKTEIQRTPSSP